MVLNGLKIDKILPVVNYLLARDMNVNVLSYGNK